MNIIGLKKANCKNCYKCIKVCPVKSIKISDEQAHIISDECILCGTCLHACPQNAKTLSSDLEKVKEFIRHGEEVYVPMRGYYELDTIPIESIAMVADGVDDFFEVHVGFASE